MRELEDKYMCTGLCNATSLNLFSTYQDGPNKLPCKDYIVAELENDFGNMGIILLLIGSFVFMSFFCQFGLCCRDKEAKTILKEKIKEKAKKHLIQKSEIGISYNTRDDIISNYLSSPDMPVSKASINDTKKVKGL